MNFDHAAARFAKVLGNIGWPTRVVWVQHHQVVYFPRSGAFIFRPLPDDAARGAAEQTFAEHYGRCPFVSLYAVGRTEDRTFAIVEAVDDPAQGEAEMFVSDGLKLSARADERTQVIRSRWLWRLLQSRNDA